MTQSSRLPGSKLRVEIAVCIECGLIKDNVESVCSRCNLDPLSTADTHAKSIRLSSRYRQANMEYVDGAFLREIGVQIERGERFSFDEDELSELLREKAALDKGLSTLDIWRITGFVLLLLLPAILFAFWWLS